MEQRAAVLQLQVNLRPGGGLCLLFGFSVEGDLCRCRRGSVCPPGRGDTSTGASEQPHARMRESCCAYTGAAQLGTRAELEKDCAGRGKKKH